MKRTGLIPLIVLGLLASACTDNTAPGNDREAKLSSPEPAAEVTSVAAATEGVGTALLIPQTMTDADLGNIPATARRCVFRMTRVGLPVLAYGSTGVLKLNDKLVSLPATGGGRYGAEGVTVTVRPLSENQRDGESFVAEFVLRLPHAPHERGYHGFSECDLPAT